MPVQSATYGMHCLMCHGQDPNNLQAAAARLAAYHNNFRIWSPTTAATLQHTMQQLQVCATANSMSTRLVVSH